MDWSTSWHDDPKWKIIWRRRPELVAACAYVYQVLAAESWRLGTRITVHDAWPPLIYYDADVVAELANAKLIDRRHMILPKTWQNWFAVALERRNTARERNRRANDNRRHGARSRTDDSADTASEPRGDSAVTLAPVPTVPLLPSVPSGPTRLNETVDVGKRTNGRRDARPVESGEVA